MDKKLESELVAQINREFYSWYFYLGMVEYLERQGLNGFGKWMRMQAKEEHLHAMRLYDYVQDRGGSVDLADIKGPSGAYNSVLDVFEKTLVHERGVTAAINGVYKAAAQANDNAALSFLQWFLGEQVEEEKTVGDIVARLKLVGDDKSGLLFLDKELGSRPEPVLTPAK
jgi:ferritin